MTTLTPLTLDHAKRNLETAVNACKDAGRKAYATINRDSPLDYFYPTAANLKSFQKRDLKAELNLQDGVKLQGVDVGQYKAILAGLEPVRMHVYSIKHAELEGLAYQYQKALEMANWNASAVEAWQVPGYRLGTKDTVYPQHFADFFKRGSRVSPPNWCVKPLAERVAYTRATAEQYALAYVQGYAVKLALKTGEAVANDPALAPLAAVLKVLRCTVSSPDLWRNSTATIVLSPDVREFSLQFHTQIIWNRSCLGLQFNQYPTRRVL